MIGHEGVALLNGVSALIIGTPESPSLLPSGEDLARRWLGKPGQEMDSH